MYIFHFGQYVRFFGKKKISKNFVILKEEKKGKKIQRHAVCLNFQSKFYWSKCQTVDNFFSSFYFFFRKTHFMLIKLKLENFMRVCFQENENKFETLLVKPYTNQVALNIVYACRSHGIIVLNDVCPNRSVLCGVYFLNWIRKIPENSRKIYYTKVRINNS